MYHAELGPFWNFLMRWQNLHYFHLQIVAILIPFKLNITLILRMNNLEIKTEPLYWY